MPITEWPDQERPREKLIAKGAENLSNAELLAIILSCGYRGKTALDVARELLNHHKNLRQLFLADYPTFSQQAGTGLAKYCQLQAALELGRRYLQESIEGKDIITQAKDAEKFLIAHMRDLEQEVFACLFLNNKHQIIRFEKLFYGSINSASVYPREVVKRALHHNAAALIVAHNHPSGIAEPSHADQQMTAQLAKALQLVEIRLLDHFVVGHSEVVSLAERGVFA